MKLKCRGGNELVHSMVSSGTVSVQTPFGGTLKEELVWPPRELSSTQAQHIGAALLQNMEMLFGVSFIMVWKSWHLASGQLISCWLGIPLQPT